MRTKRRLDEALLAVILELYEAKGRIIQLVDENRLHTLMLQENNHALDYHREQSEFAKKRIDALVVENRRLKEQLAAPDPLFNEDDTCQPTG